MLSARSLCAALAVVVAMAAVAAAQLSVDQSNSAPTNLSAYCPNQQSLYQSFKPRISPLAAIDLDVYLVPVLGGWTELRLRRGSPAGEVIAEARVFAAANGWLRFDLAAPLPVDVGDVYVIEWLRPYGWVYNNDDPYDAGWACNCLAAPYFNWDFHFRTLAGGIGLRATTWSRLKTLYDR